MTNQQKTYNLLSLIFPNNPSVNDHTAQQIDEWYQEDIKTLTNKIKQLEEQLDKTVFETKFGIPVSAIELFYKKDNTFFDINHYKHLKETNEEQSLLYLYEMGQKSKNNPYLFYKLTKDLHIPTMSNDELAHLANSLSGSSLSSADFFVRVLNLIRYTLIQKNGEEKGLKIFAYQPDFDIDEELSKMGLNGFKNGDSTNTHIQEYQGHKLLNKYNFIVNQTYKWYGDESDMTTGKDYQVIEVEYDCITILDDYNQKHHILPDQWHLLELVTHDNNEQ